MQNWELLAKSYNDISNELIDNAKLLWLNLYILALKYLEKGASRFTELLIEDEGEEKDDQAELQVFNLKEEKNKQKTIWKEKRKSRVTACLTIFCLSACGSPKSGSLRSPDSSTSAPSLSALSAPSAPSTPSALFAPSTPSIPSTPSAPSDLSALSAPSALSALFALSALSVLFAPSDFSVFISLLPALSAPSALSAFFLPAMPWLSLHTPIARRRRLIK